MKMISWRLIRMWQRNRDVFVRLWHAEAPGSIAEPVLVILAMGFGLGAYVNMDEGPRYIEYIVPGIIASYGMFSASFECTYGSFYRMEERKTYDSIIATPLSIEDVIAGEILWGATRSAITGCIILAVAAAFQLVHSPWALLIPVVSFLGGIMFASIAMVYTSFVPSFYSFNYYFTLFVTPMFFLGGVFFPLTNFPQVVQNISWAIPLASVVRLARALVTGEFYPELLLALAIILVLAAVFFVIALASMRRRVIV